MFKFDIKYFIAGMIVGAIILFFVGKKEKEIVKVPVRIEVKVPEIVKEFDTVYVPKPIQVPGPPEIDLTYYEAWKKLKDSVQRDSLFKEAITINTYKEKVEDDTIRIDLNMSVRGKLLNYQVGYDIKPRVITLDTTIEVPIPKKAEFYLGGSLFVPTANLKTGEVTPGIGPKIMGINRNHSKAVTLGYDVVHKNLEVGFLFRL